MKFNLLKYIKTFGDKFKANREEILLNSAKEISNQILYDGGLNSNEVGFLLFEINSNIKKALITRKEDLEENLKQTIEVINLIR